MSRRSESRRPAPAVWLAVGLCSAVLVLILFGYRATREWRHSLELLVERRSNEAAELLVTALTRDMRAVQRSVLSSNEFDASRLDSPSSVTHSVASAFARYPYPESFFASRGTLTPNSLTFFTQSGRPPPWGPREARANRFPVSVEREPSVAAAIVDRISTDSTAGRRFRSSTWMCRGPIPGHHPPHVPRSVA